MVKCPECGKEVENNNFCGNCGAPLQKNNCPNCGAPLSPGMKFCSSCGTKL